MDTLVPNFSPVKINKFNMCLFIVLVSFLTKELYQCFYLYVMLLLIPLLHLNTKF
jgi:hypothetical protein